MSEDRYIDIESFLKGLLTVLARSIFKRDEGDVILQVLTYQWLRYWEQIVLLLHSSLSN